MQGELTAWPREMPLSSLSTVHLEEFLRSRGQKITPGRRQILKEILGIHTHFTAEELYARTRKGQRPPSKATIYRALAVLVEGDLLETHQFGDRHLHYEIALDRKHHDHMMCVSCGRIVEFANPGLEKLQQRILDRHGFQMIHHSHKLYGICRSCRRPEKKRSRSRGASRRGGSGSSRRGSSGA